MKVMFVLDGLRAVVSDFSSEVEDATEVEGGEVLGGDDGERVEAAFVFEGTRAELLGTARALDALMARLRAEANADATLPYDFETCAVISTEWAP